MTMPKQTRLSVGCILSCAWFALFAVVYFNGVGESPGHKILSSRFYRYEQQIYDPVVEDDWSGSLMIPKCNPTIFALGEFLPVLFGWLAWRFAPPLLLRRGTVLFGLYLVPFVIIMADDDWLGTRWIAPHLPSWSLNVLRCVYYPMSAIFTG